MTYCADYDLNTCPFGCYYAKKTEKIKHDMDPELIQYVTMSKIYGTPWCELTASQK